MDKEVLCAASTADGGGNDNRGRADGCGEGSIGQADGNTITRDRIAVKRSARQSSTRRGEYGTRANCSRTQPLERQRTTAPTDAREDKCEGLHTKEDEHRKRRRQQDQV